MIYSSNNFNIHKQLLINDFIRRWGNAQVCRSCGYVLPYGVYDKIQRCCGQEMEIVKKLEGDENT